MQYELLFDELARGVERVRTLVANMTPEQARARPAPDAWSALEVVCHLYDEEREDFRQRLDIILHRTLEDFPPIEPGEWVTERGYNQRDLAEMLEKFAAERAQSLAWLQGLAQPNWETEFSNTYGTIKAGEMFSCWVAHDNLHLRQLVELRRSWLVSLAAPYDVGYAGEW